MLIFRRTFSSAVMLLQQTSHFLYPSVDWVKVEAGHYAIVDPIDNHAILYLPEKTYHIQVRVSLNTETPMVVLARPGDKQLEPTTKAPKPETPQFPTQKDLSKGTWRKFLSWHLSSLTSLTGAKRKGRKSSTAVSISAEILRTLMPYWGLDLHYRLGGPLHPTRAFIRALRDMADAMVRTFENQGSQALILRMKVSLFFLNRYLAGQKNDNPWLLDTPVGLAKNGLPKTIPLLLRRRIVTGDSFAIRLMTSIFNAYKALEGTHKEQALGSVTGLSPALDSTTLVEFEVFCKEVFWPKVVCSYVPKSKQREILNPNFAITKKHNPYIPTRAGPNSRFALFGAHLDAWAWSLETVIWPLEWAKHVGDVRTPEVFQRCLKGLNATIINEWMLPQKGDSKSPTQVELSKLELLPEPAGKVRTIAIVDYWTQRLMSPVHDWMMKILSYLPTDGTFNQEESLRTFASRMKITGNKIDSIDLKSATDLIPIELYRSLFRGVLSEDTVELWITLLTDRRFLVPSSELVTPSMRGTYVEYGRGQPMGTLSSWPSMALVHHALELFAAQKTGLDPVFFVDYRILGDDNVTGNEQVALAYREVADALCVPTSESKTISGRLFIFASQIFKDGVNLSPLSLNEELGIKTYSQRLEMALRAVRRGWLDDGRTIARFLRLLLSQKDYRSSVRAWSSGKLGRLTQSALISAFGAFSRSILDLLGIQGSGFMPFLLALRNKVEAIAGDQGRHELARVLEKDLERAYALSLAKKLVKEFDREIERLQTASIRFRMWQDGISECGYLPRAIYRTGAGGKAPELPGILVLPSTQGSEARADLRTREVLGLGTRPVTTEHGLPAKGGGKALSGSLDAPGIFNPLTRVMDSALWPVISDSYQTMFGSATIDESISDYSLVVENEEFGDPIGGWATTEPTIIGQVRSAQELTQRTLNDLVVLNDEELGDPFAPLEELVASLQKFSRLPSFTGVASFYADVKTYDYLTPWVQKIRLFKKITCLLPLGADFTVPLEADDFPVGPVGMTEVTSMLAEPLPTKAKTV
jgi:hypothetical protein